ncbi:MAG TPA: alpha/beta fold hydrolase [Rubrobacter sp.]|nr:alpha/beta fold hydrolase [Rubrobacter sp.]
MLFVHGGGEGAHEEDQKLAASLQDALGAGYDVSSPKMPNEDSPEVEAWKDRISEELAAMDAEVVLVGHSLGALFLLKYLSEEELEKPVAGLFLVAAPYVGTGGWEVEEGALRKDFASKLPEGLPVFFYHGRDDNVVPFGHLALYRGKLPRATFRWFDGLRHQFDDDLSIVAQDIEESRGPTADRSGEIDLPAELGKPVRRALVGAGYRRLEQLAGLDESEVGALHGVGPKALGQLRRALDSRRLSFAGGRDRSAGERA